MICTPWRPGACINVLFEQVNVMCPGRSKASDGTIGDAAHQAEACSSQHNSCCVRLNGVWIIRAGDITHDPGHGCDIQVLFDRIRASRDPRVRYLIFNRRICYPTARNGYAPWAWQPYNGSNPHTEHGHISVYDSPALFDNTRAWAIGGATPPGVQPAATQEETVHVRNPTGGIFIGGPNGKIGLTWDEYVSEGQPRFIQAASDARVDELLPPLKATVDSAAIAHEVAAALAADPNVEQLTEADVPHIADAVLARLKAALGAAA